MRARGVKARARTAALIAILSAASGCGGAKTVPTKPYRPAVPFYSREELLAAPEYLKFEGITFDVSVFLHRDFMPPSPPEGQPLAAIITVTAAGETRFPDGITSAYVWALKGSEIWASWMEPQGNGDVANQRVYAADGGPLWTPGSLASVVVGLRTSPTTVHLVLIPGVMIERTE